MNEYSLITHVFRWCNIKLFLKYFGKVRKTLEAHLIGNVRNCAGFLLEQTCRSL